MKKLVAVLLLIVAVETYGIYGAAQVQHIGKTCTLAIGPLCYAWETNALGKILGENYSKDIEHALVKARDAWEEDVVEKLAAKKKSGAKDLGKLIESIGDKAKDGIDAAKEAASEALEE